jgi:1-acyl-sn-glycerol-3-phosphate acyltransferase
MKVSEFFLTIYFWSLSVLCLLATSLTCLILYPFIDQKTFARVYEIMTGYVMLYLMIIPGFWSLKIIDNRRDKSWDNKRYIIIANHVFNKFLFLKIY